LLQNFLMNLNIKVQDQNSYDAIVIGSGISGGWAAKELCEGGLKVLLLERGTTVEHPNYPTSLFDPWQFEHRGELTEADKERCHVQIRHYSISEENKHFYISDLENPYSEIKRYDWIRADVVGGRSLLWARQSYRWSDLDFEANAKDGYGVDWPIRYKDIAPWYDYVEQFIGVSGQAEGIPHLPDGKFQPAMDMNCVEMDFKKKVESKFPDRKLTIGRTANLTAPVKGRGVCQYRNLCHRGCPFGAYFSTNASTLPAAFATGNLTLRPNSLVNNIIYDESKGRATGVEIVDTVTNEVIKYSSRILFLNASTLASAFILLNSTSNRFPNGLGNGSDQIGRNIMDHHKGAGANAEVEGFEDVYYYGRRPNGVYLPRFVNLNSKEKNYLRGFGYQGGASRRSWGSGLRENEIGKSLKDSVLNPGGWSIGFTGFGECLPYSDNRVTLNTDKKDKWGRPTLNVDVEFKENEKEMHKDISGTMAEMLEKVGYKNVRPYSSMSFPGNANHEMGSARMGRDPKTSVLNAFNQMHEVKNVFITDGSFMVSSSCVNPSLTYMAMTARACDYALEEMKKQNI
jgi:choline dehydrogenase-like flavoprotein